MAEISLGTAILGAALGAAAYTSVAQSQQMRKASRKARETQAQILTTTGKPPSAEDPEVQQAAQRELLELKRRRGRKATILTTGMGLEEQPLTGKKTLLGQ